MKNNMEVPQKVKNKISLSRNSTLGYILEVSKTTCKEISAFPCSVVVVVMIAKIGKQPVSTMSKENVTSMYAVNI
jgi:hypothetical protein